MNAIIKQDIEQICNYKTEWDYLSNKNILITGANGILASYMVEVILYLLEIEKINNVTIFALCRNREKAEKRFFQYKNNSNLKFIYQNVCDNIEIDSDINIIIHAASQASPKYYSTDPVGTLTPNLIGTINLLNFAKSKKIENFIYFSSAEIYGETKTSQPITETDFGYIDPLNIRSCYSESKRMGENICISWFRQYGIPVKIIRPFHTYGPGMSLNDGRVFADFVSYIVNNENIILKSDGSAKRAYCYLSDAIIAYFIIIFKGENGNAYNVGNPKEEYSVKELADVLVKIFPEKNLKVNFYNVFSSDKLVSSNVNKFLPDISKMKTLGWIPTINVVEGFKRTILSFK